MDEGKIDHWVDRLVEPPGIGMKDERCCLKASSCWGALFTVQEIYTKETRRSQALRAR